MKRISARHLHVRRIKHAVFLLTANALTLLIAFALLEIGVRAYRARARDSSALVNELRMCREDANRVWRYVSDFRGRYETPEFATSIRTNAHGLRDGPFNDDCAAYRMLFVGDSFTFGWGVEESRRYSERLMELVHRARPDLEVVGLNTGHWMYTFDQQLLVMRETLARVRPHLIVQGFYWPHVRTLASHSWERDSTGRLQRITDPALRVDANGRLRYYSEWVERPPLGSEFLSWVARSVLNWQLTRRAITSDFFLMTPGDAEADTLWPRVAAVVQETRAVVADAQAAYLPFAIPRDLQVSEREWSDVHADELRQLDTELPSRRFQQIFGDEGLRLVDLKAGFAESYQPDLYFEIDPHWTEKGHLLAASLLLPQVLSLLPPSPGRTNPDLARQALASVATELTRPLRAGADSGLGLRLEKTIYMLRPEDRSTWSTAAAAEVESSSRGLLVRSDASRYHYQVVTPELDVEPGGSLVATLSGRVLENGMSVGALDTVADTWIATKPLGSGRTEVRFEAPSGAFRVVLMNNNDTPSVSVAVITELVVNRVEEIPGLPVDLTLSTARHGGLSSEESSVVQSAVAGAGSTARLAVCRPAAGPWSLELTAVRRKEVGATAAQGATEIGIGLDGGRIEAWWGDRQVGGTRLLSGGQALGTSDLVVLGGASNRIRLEYRPEGELIMLLDQREVLRREIPLAASPGNIDLLSRTSWVRWAAAVGANLVPCEAADGES